VGHFHQPEYHSRTFKPRDGHDCCLIAKPNALILYSTRAKRLRLSLEEQMNSSRHFMRELSRLGVTSVIDVCGGFRNYLQDYDGVERLVRDRTHYPTCL
jgi:predicted amidohydrolase YtcJ